MNYQFKFLLVLTCLLFNGCACLCEGAKTFWGSSTRALERARLNASTQEYEAQVSDLFKAINQIAVMNEWKIFSQDKNRGVIVLMGIKGNVNTTEVGVFLEPQTDQKVKVAITSLSSSAKLKVADKLFAELNQQFRSI